MAAYSMDLRRRVLHDAERAWGPTRSRRSTRSVGPGSIVSSSAGVKPVRLRRGSKRAERCQHLTPEVRALTVNLIATELVRARRDKTETGTPTGTVEDVARVERLLAFALLDKSQKPQSRWIGATRPAAGTPEVCRLPDDWKCLTCLQVGGSDGTRNRSTCFS